MTVTIHDRGAAAAAPITLTAAERDVLLRELDDCLYCYADAHLLGLSDAALERVADGVALMLALRTPLPAEGSATVRVPSAPTRRTLGRLERWATDGLELYRETARSDPQDYGWLQMTGEEWDDYMASQRQLADDDLALLSACQRLRQLLA